MGLILGAHGDRIWHLSWILTTGPGPVSLARAAWICASDSDCADPSSPIGDAEACLKGKYPEEASSCFLYCAECCLPVVSLFLCLRIYLHTAFQQNVVQKVVSVAKQIYDLFGRKSKSFVIVPHWNGLPHNQRASSEAPTSPWSSKKVQWRKGSVGKGSDSACCSAEWHAATVSYRGATGIGQLSVQDPSTRIKGAKLYMRCKKKFRLPECELLILPILLTHTFWKGNTIASVAALAQTRMGIGDSQRCAG